METSAPTYRQQASPWQLIRTAIGPKEARRAKLARARATLRSWTDRGEVPRRLRRLKQAGIIDKMPTGPQLAVGALDAFRYFLIPGSADFYDQKQIGFWFHQVLRWLDDPVSMLDPAGFFSERDTIIGHLMQVVHHDPIYDLQLLLMFEDGLDEMEKQVQQVIDGTHPRAKTLRATVEEEGYFEDLLKYVREFRKNPRVHRLLREEFFRLEDPDFRRAERTFSTLTGFVAYATRLPKDALGLTKHVLFNRVIPEKLSEPEPAAIDSRQTA